jgi:NTE family protein
MRGIHAFADLPEGKLRVVATDLTYARGIVLPDDLGLSGVDPRWFFVAVAIRMSSTVPLIFQAVSHSRPPHG